MTYEVNSSEYKSVISLDAPKRYSYFIKKVCDWEEIWLLRDEKGFVLLGNPDERECLPVWPAERYPRELCCGEWKGFYPVIINIRDWMDKWIPGLIKDGRLVAVFPTPSLDSINVEPKRLLGDLQCELNKIE